MNIKSVAVYYLFYTLEFNSEIFLSLGFVDLKTGLDLSYVHRLFWISSVVNCEYIQHDVLPLIQAQMRFSRVL